MVLLLATCLFWVCTDVIVVDRISWCTSSVLKEIYIHVLPDVNEFVRVYQMQVQYYSPLFMFHLPRVLNFYDPTFNHDRQIAIRLRQLVVPF